MPPCLCVPLPLDVLDGLLIGSNGRFDVLVLDLEVPELLLLGGELGDEGLLLKGELLGELDFDGDDEVLIVEFSVLLGLGQ